MKNYDKVYVLWADDGCGERYVCGIFSSHEKAQNFADYNIYGWYDISEKTLDVVEVP